MGSLRSRKIAGIDPRASYFKSSSFILLKQTMSNIPVIAAEAFVHRDFDQ